MAVAHNLRKRLPKTKIYYVLEKGSRFDWLPKQSNDITKVYSVSAGKYRRYHGQTFLQRFFDVSTNLHNLRDFVYIFFGFFQSIRLLGKLKPDVVFIKGGFVGVPIGFACRVRRVPYFTHDSDTVPGLANRLIAKHAALHAVGMPEEFYSYNKDKIRYTGIPLGTRYQRVSHESMRLFRKELDIPIDSKVICITGGSLGAQRLNHAVVAVVPKLLKNFEKLYILHQTGSQNTLYDIVTDVRRVREVAFTDQLERFTGAADVVIARSGATTIAELAVQAKTCIFVPNNELADDQQTKNSNYIAQHNAALIINEKEAKNVDQFYQAIASLLKDKQQCSDYATALYALAKPKAADDLTDIIIEIYNKKNRNV